MLSISRFRARLKLWSNGDWCLKHNKEITAIYSRVHPYEYLKLACPTCYDLGEESSRQKRQRDADAKNELLRRARGY